MSASNHTFDAEKGVNGDRTLTVLDFVLQRAFPVYHRKLANPAPLGLFGFASTTLILSLYNAGARGITTPNAVVGMALGVGGLCQLLAGMWEFATGNTFGATGTLFDVRWLLAVVWRDLLAWFGNSRSLQGEAASQLPSALGIYLITWMIITFLLFLATFRSSVALSGVFFFLILTFMLLAISEFTGSAGAHKAGGILGCITAMIAFYTGSAGLYSPDASYFVLPVGDLPKRRDD
ncbi:GPR1/FUN34/yaaH family [Rhizoctonia solani]|uniref:GPR1/FUN34/yaaH family n=1 Tax=Rhizoctonia solani TaxID=456999 RepID=A0A8H7ILG9_9AGAM|nr:GPR1/FUN34/yaaH family [Rhizoctonia solani]